MSTKLKKELRKLMVYFSDDAPRSYTFRSYKRKIVTDLKEAEKILKEAKRYYKTYKFVDRVVIESREVSDWKEDNK